MHRPSLFLVALASLALAGCGGGGGGGSTATKSVTVAAPTDRIQPGGTLALTAFVDGEGAVAWSVDGGAPNGTITAGGIYTAPATQGTYTVRATVGGKSATKTITVFNGISIALTANATPPLTIPRSKLTFAAAVAGSSDKAVTWTATGGTIAADGTYVAPDATGTYTVAGTSHADATKTVSATVQVVATVDVRVKWLDKADVVLSLNAAAAPNTAANYVTLVNKGFYDGIFAHRYVPNFVIQWGDPLTKSLPLTDSSIGTGGPGYTIPFEITGLSNVRYSLAMARETGADTAGSQVYVNLVDNLSLDHTSTTQGYVVFGAVVSGQATIDALRVGDKIVSAKVEAAP